MNQQKEKHFVALLKILSDVISCGQSISDEGTFIGQESIVQTNYCQNPVSVVHCFISNYSCEQLHLLTNIIKHSTGIFPEVEVRLRWGYDMVY